MSGQDQVRTSQSMMLEMAINVNCQKEMLLPTVERKRMGSVLSKDHWSGEETREMVGCQHNISVL